MEGCCPSPTISRDMGQMYCEAIYQVNCVNPSHTSESAYMSNARSCEEMVIFI